MNGKDSTSSKNLMNDNNSKKTQDKQPQYRSYQNGISYEDFCLKEFFIVLGLTVFGYGLLLFIFCSEGKVKKDNQS